MRYILGFFVSRLRLAACALDGQPETARKAGASMANEFARSAPFLPLARAIVDPTATDRLAKDFTRLLHDCKPKRWSREMPDEEIKAAALEDERDFEKVAPRFGRAALVACGYTPEQARNIFEFDRKRRDRGDRG